MVQRAQAEGAALTKRLNDASAAVKRLTAEAEAADAAHREEAAAVCEATEGLFPLSPPTRRDVPLRPSVPVSFRPKNTSRRARPT